MSSIQSIGDRAMLVGLKITQFSATRTDDKISREVAKQHGNREDMGSFKKLLIEKSAIDPITKLAGSIRQEHYRRTLPWADDGARILTSTGYDAYMCWFRGEQAHWEEAVGEFMDKWDESVSNAKEYLGSLFQPAEYPTREQLKTKFSIRHTVRPISQSQDFRVKLNETEIAAIRADMEADNQLIIKSAMQDTWTRMYGVTQRMVERLKLYNPEKPGESRLYDSVVTNIKDLLEVLPSLNLTGDADMDDLSRQMKELVKHSTQNLKDNHFARTETIQRAEAILSHVTPFIA